MHTIEMRFMNRLISFLGLYCSLITIVSCTPEVPAKTTINEVRGTRSYKLDPEAAAIQVSIYGTAMGTPDTAKFSYLMRMLKNAGELISVLEKDPGIEGGITICGVFSAAADRDGIYEILRSTETDSKYTNFIATSVSNCSN
jgi:hypothetical protein